MRQCRPMMVRTLKQYMFVYDVLFEALITHHAIVGEDVNISYRLLNRVNPQSNHSYFHEQFKILEQYTELQSAETCVIGLSETNKDKNRFSTIRLLSRDQDRPVLTGGLVNTNYINAVYIDSYTRRRAFIVTQTPLSNTVEEFLALIYDFRVSCVIAMNGSDYVEDTCASYCPAQDGQTVHTQCGINVTLLKTTNTEHVTIRKLQLTNENASHSIKPRHVMQFQFQSWKMYDQVPWSREGIMQLMEMVADCSSPDGFASHVLPPVVVHCVDGANQSGLFCAAWNVCEKMRHDHEVDIFHTVKALKTKRFHFINSLAQYKFCFKLVWDYVNTRLKQQS